MNNFFYTLMGILSIIVLMTPLMMFLFQGVFAGIVTTILVWVLAVIGSVVMK